MSIKIRPGELQDIDVIFDIRTSVKENHLSRAQLTELGITEAVIADLIANESGIWVAEFDQQVCGFAIADQDEGSVFAMFIYPEFEGKGLGTVLLKTAEDFLFQHFSEIWLETDRNSRAYQFYLHHNWRVEEELENHDVKMVKQRQV